jgi:hypothetical protein
MGLYVSTAEKATKMFLNYITHVKNKAIYTSILSYVTHPLAKQHVLWKINEFFYASQ